METVSSNCGRLQRLNKKKKRKKMRRLILFFTIVFLASSLSAAMHTDCYDFCVDIACHLQIEDHHDRISGCTNVARPEVSQGCILSLGPPTNPNPLSAMVCQNGECRISGKLKCSLNNQLPKFPSFSEQSCPGVVKMKPDLLGNTSISCHELDSEGGGHLYTLVCAEDGNSVLIMNY